MTGAVEMNVVAASVGTVRSRFCHRVTDVTRYGLAGAVVSALLDPVPEFGEVCPVRVVGDGCSLGDCIRLNGANPIETTERSFDDRLLGRPMKSGHVENCGCGRGGPFMLMAGV